MPKVPKVPDVPRVPDVQRASLHRTAGTLGTLHFRHFAHVRHLRHLRHFRYLAIALLAFTLQASASEPFTYSFGVAAPAEIIATVTARCDQCDWSVEGREAVVLTLTLDGRSLRHLPLVRTGRAEYRVLMGEVPPGPHALAIDEAAGLTARSLRGGKAVVERVSIEQVTESSPEYRAIVYAPILFARPDSVGRFTDVPVFMWYEVEPTSRGTRYRYSVIFTNEDGGTPADRLMATWGRTTDIEYVHSVEVGRDGHMVDADMQGPKHEVLPFRGLRVEGVHPLLWVSTDNNMVLDRGTTDVRYAPAPVLFSLADVSRERVMDAHPWLYEVAAKELIREGKIAANAPPGKGQIPDPRRFVYVEACGEVGTSALAFAIQIGNEWLASDRGVPEYRIVRDGCFRVAIPVPMGTTARDIRALRAQAYSRTASGKSQVPAPSIVRLTTVNRVFMLDDTHTPQPSVMQWSGSRSVTPDGSPIQILPQ